jgi:hypothetical protein
MQVTYIVKFVPMSKKVVKSLVYYPRVNKRAIRRYFEHHIGVIFYRRKVMPLEEVVFAAAEAWYSYPGGFLLYNIIRCIDRCGYN